MFNWCGYKVALMICYDIEFAQHCFALRQQGVEILFVPTANMMPYINVPETLVPARAAETNMVVAYSNTVAGRMIFTIVVVRRSLVETLSH